MNTLRLLLAVSCQALSSIGFAQGEEDGGRCQGWCEYQQLEGEVFPAPRLNLPEWACKSAFHAALHTRYTIYSGINPSFITADFDGDGKQDIAIWVTNKASGKRGLVLLRSGGGRPVVLGAGTEWEQRGDDFSGLDMWSVLPHGTRLDSPYEQRHGVSTRGDIIVLTKSESASFAIYWNGSRYVSYQLSD